ncbi:5903_t:CDS:1, partial [Racocetra persica]
RKCKYSETWFFLNQPPVNSDTLQSAVVSNILSEEIVDKEHDDINHIQTGSKGDK